MNSEIPNSTSTLNVNGPSTPSQWCCNAEPRNPQPQTIPGVHYPFALAPEEFPETFYRLHLDDNWRDLSNVPPTSARGNSRTSLQGIDRISKDKKSEINGPHPHYNPPEHGWTAKNTHAALPFSATEILATAREHFQQRGASSLSIFVPGIWNPRRFSAVSLFDNPQDALEEGKLFGGPREGVRVYPVDGGLLRKEGTVVFCMEELLGRDSSLCMITKGRYRQRKGIWKKGSGLRGKAYLVVGVIPGTHNSQQTSPSLSKTSTDTSRIEVEKDDINIVGKSRIPSLPLASTHIEEQNSNNFDIETFELEQSDTTLQTQSTFAGNKASIPTERSERAPFGWDLNERMNTQLYVKKEDIQELRGHRNSAEMTPRMEEISEDTIIVDSNPIQSTQSQPPLPSKMTKEIPRSRNNPVRRINSSAKITRKGTFGTRPSSRGDIQNDSVPSLSSQPSHNLSKGPKTSGKNINKINIGTSNSDDRDGYSSDDSLSAGSDIPAIATKKRVVPAPTMTPSNTHPNKRQKSSDHHRSWNGDPGLSSVPVVRSFVAEEDKYMERSLDGYSRVESLRAETGPLSRSNNPTLDHGETMKPIPISIPKSRFEMMVKRNSSPKNKELSIDMVPEEWPLKNKGQLTRPGENLIQRNVADKGTYHIDTTYPEKTNSHSNRTESYHPIYNEFTMGRRPKAKAEAEPKPVPDLKEEEKVWSFKGVIAFEIREYDGQNKHCYLIEWEEPWAPTWQWKSETDEVLKKDWKKNYDFWNNQLKTKAGRNLAKDKKIEKILFDEKDTYLVKFTSNLRPEWVKTTEVDKALVRDFERRKKKWRYEDDSLGEVDIEDKSEEEEEALPGEVEAEEDQAEEVEAEEDEAEAEAEEDEAEEVEADEDQADEVEAQEVEAEEIEAEEVETEEVETGEDKPDQDDEEDEEQNQQLDPLEGDTSLEEESDLLEAEFLQPNIYGP
ncbi:hypothetical protein NHQ30_008497 [Ciborinia camelliae]|nr:hypothetical protein NHQ30_008497 [Ciborinia camelliae]